MEIQRYKTAAEVAKVMETDYGSVTDRSELIDTPPPPPTHTPPIEAFLCSPLPPLLAKQNCLTPTSQIQ